MFWYQGDTGDPAVLFSGNNRAGTLYGIALFSGTEECANKSKPGVFAQVSNFVVYFLINLSPNINIKLVSLVTRGR